MRSALLGLVAITACYRPAPDKACELTCTAADSVCPGNLVCSAGNCVAQVGDRCDGVDGDGGVVVDDVMSDDAAMTASCLFTATPIRLNVGADTSSGRPYSVTQNQPAGTSRYAVYQRVDIFRAEPDDPGLQLIYMNQAGAQNLVNPYVSPEGFEVYGQRDFNGDSLVEGIGMSVVNGDGSLQPPDPVTLLDETSNLLAFDEPPFASAPTLSTLPAGQRMMIAISQGGTRLMMEMRRTAASSVEWQVVDRYTMPELANDIAIAFHPTMSPDGLRVVFIGGTVAAGSKIYGLRRESVTNRFTTPAELVADINAARYPFTRFDCGALYYFTVSTNDIMRVGPPTP